MQGCRNALGKKRRMVYAKRNKRRKDKIPSGTKRCGASIHVGNRHLPYTRFSRSYGMRDGFNSECKACSSKRDRNKRAREDEESSSSSSE